MILFVKIDLKLVWIDFRNRYYMKYLVEVWIVPLFNEITILHALSQRKYTITSYLIEYLNSYYMK